MRLWQKLNLLATHLDHWQTKAESRSWEQRRKMNLVCDIGTWPPISDRSLLSLAFGPEYSLKPPVKLSFNIQNFSTLFFFSQWLLWLVSSIELGAKVTINLSQNRLKTELKSKQKLSKNWAKTEKKQSKNRAKTEQKLSKSWATTEQKLS